MTSFSELASHFFPPDSRKKAGISVHLRSTIIWSKSQNPHYFRQTLPWALFIVALLAYGLLLPRLGFYWDDWPWIWLYHTQGPQRLLAIDQVSRPLAGEILWLGSWLAGESPFGWQLLNWFYRWLSAISLAWMLRKLWPSQMDRIAWISLIFLVYPAFRQQYISINSSRHILPMAAAFLSMGFMLWAVRTNILFSPPDEKKHKSRFIWLTLISLGLMAFEMLATEYYYGLELVRPVFLWLALDPVLERFRRIKLVFLNWLPYLAMSAGLFTWRYLVSPRGNYPIVIVDQATNQPIATIQDLLVRLINSFTSSAFLAWKHVIDLNLFDGLGIQYPVIALALVAGTTLLAWVYLYKGSGQGMNQGIQLKMIGLGGFSILVTSLPFLVTGLRIDLNFPSDRTYLPMLFGSSLLLIGLIDGIIRKYRVKIFVVALLTGLAVGMHLMTGIAYYKDWQSQISFFHQLITRAPGLQSGTTILYEYTLGLQDFRSTDNSLKAPLNWVYAPNLDETMLPLNIADLRIRDEYQSLAVNEDESIIEDYFEYRFSGSSNKILPVSFAPASCLTILEPKYSGLYPHLPDHLANAVQLGNPSLLISPTITARWPEEVFGPQPEPGWCIYYQQAEAARQRGDWQTVVAIGDLAFQPPNSPREPLERFPFILGYGYAGDWKRAADLTLSTLQQDNDTAGMLCSAWQELAVNTPDSIDKGPIVTRVLEKLDCPR